MTKKFCDYIFKHFDINRFKDIPFYKKDFLLNNYFMFDYNGKKIRYRGLLPKYNKFLLSLEKKKKK
jgi:hypothetical protein